MSDFFTHPLSALEPQERDLAQQRTAARISAWNANKSTGPKTEAGKRISSQNAFKHGFAGSRVVINEEDKEAYEGHLDGYIARFNPVDLVEADTVRRAANSIWQHDRLCTIEATLLEWESEWQAPKADAALETFEPRHLWALGFKEQCGERALETCRRYQATHLREFERNVQMFYQLQKRRNNDRASAVSIPAAKPATEAKPAQQKAPTPNELPLAPGNSASNTGTIAVKPVNKSVTSLDGLKNRPKAA